MFLPQKALNSRKLTTKLCRQGMDKKWHCLAEEEAREGTEISLTAYGVPLSQVTSFKYLGRVLAVEDNDCPEVVRNLRSARHKWEWPTQVLSKEGEDSRTPGQIYVVVVQLVLLYRSLAWVLTPRMQRVMGGLHHSVDRRLTGKK